MSEGDSRAPASTVPRLGKRGMSMTFAIVIMVVVILVVGLGGYFGLASVKSTSATTTTCTGTSCVAVSTTDATLFVPFSVGYGQKMVSVAAGLNISATVGVKGTETIKSFAVAWGDGASSTGPTATFGHAYASPGLYLIQGNATDTSGKIHTGPGQLFPVSVTQGIAQIEKGIYPTLATTFTNGTSGGIYPWAAVGSVITVNGSYAKPPTDPLYSTLPPTLTAGTGVTVKGTVSSGATYASGSFTLNAAGYDTVTFTGTTETAGGTPITFTYVWSVWVVTSTAGLGCSACSAPTIPSPHPGELVTYEGNAPGGPVTIDPAGDYFTVGYEVNAQVDQTLITYNGTDVSPGPANYVPEVATCVPGTTQCGDLYPGAPGTDLVSGYNYTFVISSAAKFYDPSTGKSWPIYPSDVYFSFLRSISFANLPAVAIYPGWITAQGLVGAGNATWDSGIHWPYNNTPQNMLGAMMVNDSTFCTAAMMSGANNGCITFDVYGANEPWPAFYSYISIPSAAAVTPCSWYSYEGATVPGFMGSPGAVQKVADDTGCLLPGGVTSTSDPGFTTWMATQGPTSWDSYQGLAVSNYPSPNPSVQWTAVGSGPYYIEALNPGVSIAYKANPAYVQPVACAGESYCQPVPGTYAQTVQTYWQSDDTVGVQEFTAGYADYAYIEPAHTSTLLKLLADGLIGQEIFPSLSTYNFAYNTAIDISSLKTFDPEPVNIQSNSLSYSGLRGFLTAAYPYASVQAEYNVIDGIQGGFNYGGFIPEFMGNYYPTNVSWPDYNVTTGLFSDPSSNAAQVGSAAWYWAQLTNPSSNLYDKQFGAGGQYSASTPLHVPALFFEGDPTHQSVLDLWSSFVTKLSGGAVVFDVFPVSPSIVYSNLLPDGACPWALWFMGWAADYAQPADYWTAYGAASGTWSSPDALAYSFVGSQYNSPSCTNTNPSLVSSLYYWADQPYIPDDCQGIAYNVTLYWANVATHDPNVAQGTLFWNRVSAVYSLLNLYGNTEQVDVGVAYAPWVNPASIPQNLIEGTPGGVNLWWEWTGNGVA